MAKLAGLTAAAAASLLLCGCWSDQQQALNACLVAHPFKGLNPAPMVYGTHMADCMSKAGYRPDLDTLSCKMAAVPRRDAFCYAPDSYWSRLGYRIEMLFHPGPSPNDS